MRTLSQIASEGLALLAHLRPHPLDTTIEIVAKLGRLATDLDAHRKNDLANKVTVLLLSVAPVPDHATRPAKLETFAVVMVDQVAKELMGLLEA